MLKSQPGTTGRSLRVWVLGVSAKSLSSSWMLPLIFPKNKCEQLPISYLSTLQTVGPNSHSLLRFFSDYYSKFRMEKLAAGYRP